MTNYQTKQNFNQNVKQNKQNKKVVKSFEDLSSLFKPKDSVQEKVA